MKPIHARINFNKKLREWDGFGVNYVETAQTQDYKAFPQDRGGFSRISEADRLEILGLIFGEEGLKPGILKMFLDPFHQEQPHGPFNHATTTQWMRYFARGGSRITRERGAELKILTGLYSPPGWMTLQRILRGRDLDPDCEGALANYLIDWIQTLIREDHLSVAYLSPHNEGEDINRWFDDGSTEWNGHDYNMYWPSSQVVRFLQNMRPRLDAAGLEDVQLASGETVNWYRFSYWGYADAIAGDPHAARNLGLVTSHDFSSSQPGKGFGDHCSAGIDLLRSIRPEIHSWVTSLPWGKNDVFMLDSIRRNIYSAKINGLIMWAVIKLQGAWVGYDDPKKGTGFRVTPEGKWSVEDGYYFYKQVTRAGQPGTAVCQVQANDSRIGLIGFSGQPDAWVALNLSEQELPVDITIGGSRHPSFSVFRSSPSEHYVELEPIITPDGHFSCTLPPLSATTYFGC